MLLWKSNNSEGAAEMNPNDIMKQFKKYGAYGQLTSIGFFVLVFSFAYPLNRDRELLWFLIASAFRRLEKRRCIG
jgi:hypothetical protein